jgi:hypothetical protein
LTIAAYQAPRSIGGVGRPDKPQPARIVLAGKLSLPEGYGGDNKNRARRSDANGDDASVHSISSRFTVNSNVSGKVSLGSVSEGGTSVRLRMPQGASSAATSRAHARNELRNGLTPVIESVKHGRDMSTGEGNETCSESDGDGDSHDDSDEKTSNTQWTRASRKAETVEEKKARKEAAKNEQRIRRQNKKTLRNVYTEEKEKVFGAAARKQTIDHVSVFKY